MQIATRSDLETLRGTPAYNQFLDLLRGTLTTRTDVQVYPAGYDSSLQIGSLGYLPPVWEERPTPEVAAKYGLTPQELNPSWNPVVVTPAPVPVPAYDPATQQVRFTAAGWVVESIPQPDDATVYAEHQAAGYLDATTGIRLKATDAAQGSFTKFVALTMLAMQASAITSATEQSIWDYNNVERVKPTGELLALLLRYGLYCSTMFKNYAP